ncbi:MAG: hypothetical protein AAB263_03595 [Planctomycetota bacterium]
MNTPVLSIPLPLVQDDEAAWPDIVAAMQRLGAGRVILYSAMLPNPANSIRHYRARLGAAADQDVALLGIAPDLAFYDLWAELLAQRQAQFAAVGIPVAFWMGQTLGHPGGFNGSTSGVRPPFQHEMDVDGKEIDSCLCPLCPRLRDYLTGALARIARARPEFIILDDDFRLLRQNPNWCMCPLHLAAFRRRGMPDLPRRDLLRLALSGKAGPERAAWWSVHEDGQIDLGRALGEAIRAVAPQVRLGLCTTHSCWDNLDLPRLLSAMAGPLRPLFRGHGAPYWLSSGHKPPFSLGGIVEQTRQQRAWLKAALPTAEDMCEGDTFPHLSTRCPVTTYDAWHQALLAAGARRFLSYACSYVSPLHFETGYTDALINQRTRYAAICELAPEDARDLGVTAPCKLGAMRRLTNPPGTERPLTSHDCPPPLQLCARLGIPVAYDCDQGPVLLTGRQAALANDAELTAWAGRGLVLDAVAADVLRSRGIACGISATALTPAPNVERFLHDTLNGPFAGGPVAMWSSRPAVYHRVQPLPDAIVVSDFHDAADNSCGPAVLRWQDATDRRFAVLGWDLEAAFGEFQLHWSHARRYQLQRLLAWVGRAPLPCTVDAANVQVTVRRRRDGGTAIGVLNCGLDPLTPVLRLSPELAAAKHVRLLPPEGDATVAFVPTWQNDGEARLLSLPCRVPAHGFCLLSLAP